MRDVCTPLICCVFSSVLSWMIMVFFLCLFVRAFAHWLLSYTGRDEPWPFFHFWRHHIWPKLASSILNFCRRKRSFQWCPDQSARPNGAWDMHKNAQNVEWKTKKKNRNGEKGKAKKKNLKKSNGVGHFLISKFWFLRMPEPKCRKTRC